MNLKKKELIITVIMIITFIIVGLNVNVLASTHLDFSGVNSNNSSNTNNNIERVNTTNETANNVTPNTANNTTNNTANNTPGNLANTGLEDAPWLIIGICAVSAVFAYNKIKEYKSF